VAPPPPKYAFGGPNATAAENFEFPAGVNRRRSESATLIE